MSDSADRFPDVPGGYPFPELEVEVLEEWAAGGIFAATLAASAGRPEFVFYEGPPTANNAPHVGHVVTRAVKDLYPRFRTMRGFHVPRKAGWDTHGLPVEIEVEKQLGFSGKREIEAYGIAAFNRACLESVHTYERQWRAMTERVGYWIDLDNAYYTYSNRYVESVWWALATLFARGLLTEGYKIQPYCARCGTTLSSHEVAQNYRDVDDPSIWALFAVEPGQRLAPIGGGTFTTGEHLDIVAWTTTPWTTIANVGLAVHPELVYRVVEDPRREEAQILLAEGLDTPVPVPVVDAEGKRAFADLRDQPALARFRGRALEGLRYERLFHFFAPEAPGRIVLGDYVTPAEGTGVVHTAPPFGEDDQRTGRRYDLPFILSVDSEGRIVEGAGPFSGLWFKDADPPIIRELEARGRLLHHGRHRHSYPFCWRCDRPLLYYASRSWFVATTKEKEKIVAANRRIGWHPAHIGEGRFGNWLEGLVDWALSRKRYWGTPLPIWRCDRCGDVEVVGSFAELFSRAGRDLPADPYDRELFDPHRPFVDPGADEPFVWPCEACGGGTMARVDDVVDAWFDSGAMPFAQHHYPFEHRELIDAGEAFPADFIAEAVDQTRGWFYTLHVLGVLLFDSVAYRNSIVLGHVNDEEGRKMSKRLGNVVEPMAVVAETGADALRWYFYVNNPEIPSRFSARLVREAAQRFLLPLWNALSFFTIYANIDDWHPERASPVAFGERPALDRWILLRLGRLTAETTAHLESYRTAEAARALEAFVDDLTNWYIRRSRDRFWAAEPAAGKESAYQALHEVLVTLARLLAPFIPFAAEVLHRHLVRSQQPEAPASVHLESWPLPVADRDDPRLEAGMAAVQRIVSLGHAARNAHGIKTRQPLLAVTVVSADPEIRRAADGYEGLVRDELNVRRVEWADDRSAFVRHAVRPVFPKCGPRFGKRMPRVQRALAEADGDRLAAELESGGSLRLEVDGEVVELSAEEVEVRLEEKEGAAIQGDRELLVALDTTLTADLVAEGLAREVVHQVQTARKEAELDYADRIRVRFRAAPELASAIDEHRDWIAAETLAVALEPSEDGAADLLRRPIEGLEFALAIERA